MGKIDIASKDYFGKPERFAAVFNYLLYDGKQVIDPKSLQPVNSMCRSMREHDQETKVVSALSVAQDFINDEKQLVDFVSMKCAVAPAIVNQILGRMKTGAHVTA